MAKTVNFLLAVKFVSTVYIYERCQSFFFQFALNDSHYLAYVHWAGDHRDTIVVLTRDKNPRANSNSHVWVSKDYARTFTNMTSSFMVSRNSYALIDMFHASPVDNTKVSGLVQVMLALRDRDVYSICCCLCG